MKSPLNFAVTIP